MPRDLHVSLMKPLVALATPGMYLLYKFNQYKRQQQEQNRRKVTEKELAHLNHKIDKLLTKLDEHEPELATCPEEECVVCISAKASMQTYPCGHKVVCRKCFVKTIQMAVSQRLLPLRCVICRAKILRLKQTTGSISSASSVYAGSISSSSSTYSFNSSNSNIHSRSLSHSQSHPCHLTNCSSSYSTSSAASTSSSNSSTSTASYQPQRSPIKSASSSGSHIRNNTMMVHSNTYPRLVHRSKSPQPLSSLTHDSSKHLPVVTNPGGPVRGRSCSRSPSPINTTIPQTHCSSDIKNVKAHLDDIEAPSLASTSSASLSKHNYHSRSSGNCHQGRNDVFINSTGAIEHHQSMMDPNTNSSHQKKEYPNFPKTIYRSSGSQRSPDSPIASEEYSVTSPDVVYYKPPNVANGFNNREKYGKVRYGHRLPSLPRVMVRTRCSRYQRRNIELLELIKEQEN
ncbi:hypothetical protein CHUAL_007275 [Chamberlinius hualienensis]